MKRLLILGDAGSSHLVKWILALHGRYELCIFSLNLPALELRAIPGLRMVIYNHSGKTTFAGRAWQKLGYLRALPALRNVTQKFDPHLVHAHYATSYGLLAGLLGRKPLVISVWGSDVYEFPQQGLLHRMILRRNLRKADLVLSTSEAMKVQTQNFTSQKILVTPFGVDTSVFVPLRSPDDSSRTGAFVFGLVKSMQSVYGVDLLIRSFAKLVKKHPGQNLQLRLVGGGSALDTYRVLAQGTGVADRITFTGRIAHDAVAAEMQKLDVLVNPSRAESFGVTVVEAMSCGLPVIVSAAGGLPEVVGHGNAGLIVRTESVDDLMEKMEWLLLDETLRMRFSVAGRNRAMEFYDWKKSVDIMVNEVYTPLLDKFARNQ